MTTVQNIGAPDYQMPITQQDQLPIPEDFSNEPAMYDPALEEKKEAAGSMKGLMIGGLIGAAGIGLGVWKGMSASKYKKMAEALKQEKAALETQLKDRTGFKNVFKRPFVAFWEGLCKLGNKLKFWGKNKPAK